MPVTVVVGGQFGSEGKGKVAFELARREDAKIAIRVGGPNSGHTVHTADGKRYVLRQLPTAALLPGVLCLLPAGSYISLPVLQRELAVLGPDRNRVMIHPNACIITDEQVQSERKRNLNGEIGSTETGIGAAVRDRTWRTGQTRLAKDCLELAPLVNDFTSLVRANLSVGSRVVVEGTQGFGLSVLHSDCYPFATSRDTTAASFISEAGLSPLDVDDIVLVLRAFPIRVAGNSGPLPKETTWEKVASASGSQVPFVEYTSVTQRVRRVAHFDPDVVKRAIAHNNPTRLVLNHIDQVDVTCRGSMKLGPQALSFVAGVENSIERKIDFVGTSEFNMVGIREATKKAREAA